MRPRQHLHRLPSAPRFDYWLAVFAILLAFFGVLMIFEASNVSAYKDFGDKYHYIKEQSTWLVLGVITMFVTAAIPYKKYFSLVVPLMIISLASLMAVFIPGIGIKTLGAHRWVGVGPINFQPSELMKFTLILYLATWLSSKEKGRFLAFVLLFIVIEGLVMLQPDLGTAIILGAIFLVMYFASGAPLAHFGLLIPSALAAVLLLSLTSSYRFSRLMTFFNSNQDPLGSSYHVRQILVSFGSGGLWGVGLGASRQKYQFLPEATTDSIFAIIGEELGFIGASILIIFLILFLYKIYTVAKNTSDKQGMLLASGILALFGFQIIINLGAMVVLFPLTGIPLPFISYGGSNLVISFAAIGILLNISRSKPASKLPMRRL